MKLPIGRDVRLRTYLSIRASRTLLLILSSASNCERSGLMIQFYRGTSGKHLGRIPSQIGRAEDLSPTTVMIRL